MSGPKTRLTVTPAQATYLLELVQDDLANTEDLTKQERQQAHSIRDKLAAILVSMQAAAPEHVRFDPRSTGQRAPRL